MAYDNIKNNINNRSLQILMPELLFWIGAFILGLFILIKASDYFTHSAEKVGLYFGMPPFIVGVTIVAFGTSLPELVSSIFAVFRKASEIVVANVIGSNIANIFLILGLAAVVGKSLKTDYKILHVDLPILIGSAFLLGIAIWDGKFLLVEGFLLIAGIVIYYFYVINVKKSKIGKKENHKVVEKLDSKTVVILIVSAFFIYAGAKYTIESVVEISRILDIGKEIIAVTAVALGTSLPELAVSIKAARKGKSEIALGNVLGSNIFNSFAVMGIPALFGTLAIPQNILMLALPVMIIATLLFFFMMLEKEITKWEGYMLLLFYVFFIGKSFNIF
jgi:cation:H+ antiporter